VLCNSKKRLKCRAACRAIMRKAYRRFVSATALLLQYWL